MRKKGLTVFFIMFLFSHVFLVAKNMEEGIIKIILNDSYIDDSFPVFFDESESPLIEIEEFIHLADINDSKVKSGDFIYKTNGEWYTIPNIISYEGLILIDPKNIPESEVIWDFKISELSIDLPYNLPKDFILKKEREREKFKNKEKETELLKEEWKLFTPGVLGITYGKHNIEDRDDYASFDYVNHLLYGTSELNVSVENNKYKIDTYRWQRYIGEERKVVLGDSYINTPTSLGDSTSFRGFSVFKKNSWDEALNVDNTSISGFASNGIVVELYENRILKGYQIVSNGRYKFNVDVRSGNKSYEVWLYKEDGTIDKKQVSIYGDTNLLDLGEVDYDLQIGKDLDRKGYTPYNTNLYYGVTQNLTMQFGLYNNIFKGSEKHYLNISPVFRIGTTSKWSHLIAGNYVQNLSLKSENYQRLELESSNNTITNTFGFENYQGFHNDEINESYDEKQYWRATFPIMDIQTNVFYEHEKNSETTLDINRYGFNMYQSYFRDKLTISGGMNEEQLLQKNSGTKYKSLNINLGIGYNITDKRLIKVIDTVGTEYENRSGGNNTYSMYIRRNSRADRHLDYFLSLKSEKDDLLWKFTLSYKFGDKLNIRTTTDSDKYNNITTGIEARTTVNLGAPKGEKIYYSNYTGDSNVYGKVFLDANNNGVMDADEEGMSDFIIQLNSKDWKSNKDGSFYMSLLSSNTHHTLNIRSENMDLLNYKYQKIYKLRSLPGGSLRLDIPIIPLKSVVGILEFDENMYIEDIRTFIKNTKIKIKGINNKIEVDIKITDEYFIRDLPTGDYSIEFISQNDEILKSKTYNFNVPLGELDSEKYLDIGIKFEDKKFKVEISE